jgi:hypothetical protein
MKQHVDYWEITCDAWDACPVTIHEADEAQAVQTLIDIGGGVVEYGNGVRGYYCADHLDWGRDPNL